ncbi:hypothetical protein [Herbaspirillum sp. YR522]|uniref:hypothetical protein n=1 Tax=Herbaspirillum sp. YR522 TaxID=1144342 RepID=UPI0012F794A7|nr:hypothetical protein [Herbaspirillum sp. YR522]
MQRTSNGFWHGACSKSGAKTATWVTVDADMSCVQRQRFQAVRKTAAASKKRKFYGTIQSIANKNELSSNSDQDRAFPWIAALRWTQRAHRQTRFP